MDVSTCECKPRLTIVNRISGEMFSPDCRAYKCPHCGRLKVWMLRKSILEWFKNQKLRLLTLTTTNRYNQTIGKDLCEESWKVFSRWLRKEERVGKRVQNVQYVKLRERQKNGQFHFHLIVNQFINWETLQPVWIQSVREVLAKYGIFPEGEDGKLGNANFVGEKTGCSHRLVAWYITKYVSKYCNAASEAKANYDMGFQRYRPYATSRNVHLFTRNPSTGEWTIYKYSDTTLDQLLYLSSTSLIPQENSAKLTKILSKWALAKLFPDLYPFDGVDFEST